MELKFCDSERKVMDVLWKHGDMRASQIANILEVEIRWNRNTTYTIIKKCIEKGAIERSEPNFQCKTLVSRSEAQEYATEDLINKMFDGSRSAFLASFVSEEKLTTEEIEYLKELVQELK